VRQTIRRGNSARLVPYIRGPGRPLRGARRPWARDAGEMTEQEPARKGAHEILGTFDANVSRAKRLLERDIAEPHDADCRQGRGHDQIDPMAGILETHVDLLTAGDEPRGRRAATGRHATKLEPHDDAPVRETVDREPAPDVPHEQHRVEVLGRGAPVDPPLAPGAE